MNPEEKMYAGFWMSAYKDGYTEALDLSVASLRNILESEDPKAEIRKLIADLENEVATGGPKITMEFIEGAHAAVRENYYFKDGIPKPRIFRSVVNDIPTPVEGD